MAQRIFIGWPLWIQILISAVVALVGIGILPFAQRQFAKEKGNGMEQSGSPGASQFGDHTTIHGDFAGRDIDKSTHVYNQSPIPQSIVPVLNGEVRGPNIYVNVTNTDNLPHSFRIVFHDVRGMVGQKRVRDAWLPWHCSDFQMIGPGQSDIIQVAQADGETRDVGKVITFAHDKDKAYNSRLSE